MTLRKILFSAVVCLGLLALTGAGCTGILEPGDPINPADPPDAGNLDGPEQGELPSELFNNTLAAVVDAKCALCHGRGANTKFLATTVAEHYTVLMEDYPGPYVGATYQNSSLYTFAVDPFHYNPFNEQQAEDLKAWIQAEYDYHNQSDDQDPAAPDNPPVDCGDAEPHQCALLEFARCFNFEQWESLGVYRVGNNASAQGTCSGCHATGTGGFYADGQSQSTYDKWKQSPYISKIVNPVFNNGEFVGLVASSRIELKSQALAGHPSYTLAPLYKQAIDDFVASTLTAYSRGNCP